MISRRVFGAGLNGAQFIIRGERDDDFPIYKSKNVMISPISSRFLSSFSAG